MLWGRVRGHGLRRLPVGDHVPAGGLHRAGKVLPQRCKNCVSAPVGAAPSSDDKVDEVRPPDAKQPRFVGAVYGGPFADFVIKGKIPLTVLFCLILVSSMVVWNLLLVRATSATDWFVSDHPYTLHDKATKYKFLEERTDEKGVEWLVAGISPDNPWELTGGAASRLY